MRFTIADSDGYCRSERSEIGPELVQKPVGSRQAASLRGWQADRDALRLGRRESLNGPRRCGPWIVRRQ